MGTVNLEIIAKISYSVFSVIYKDLSLSNGTIQRCTCQHIGFCKVLLYFYQTCNLTGYLYHL